MKAVANYEGDEYRNVEFFRELGNRIGDLILQSDIEDPELVTNCEDLLEESIVEFENAKAMEAFKKFVGDIPGADDALTYTK